MYVDLLGVYLFSVANVTDWLKPPDRKALCLGTVTILKIMDEKQGCIDDTFQSRAWTPLVDCIPQSIHSYIVIFTQLVNDAIYAGYIYTHPRNYITKWFRGEQNPSCNFSLPYPFHPLIANMIMIIMMVSTMMLVQENKGYQWHPSYIQPDNERDPSLHYSYVPASTSSLKHN